MSTPITTQAAARYISKSKFLHGFQCPKLLWTAYNAKHLIPEPKAQTQAFFDQGHQVGNMAKKLFTNSVEVGEGVDNLDKVLRLTQEAIKSRRPFFEPAFAYQGGYARADILDPLEGNSWDIIEVKSSTSARNVYIFD
jgi:hypothetical protein